ncbi:MAG: phosphatidate cytidylyltransferase [Pirellulaceae bacterium]|nr:phosphatidate cytidylyltransferase [Pirellulaceae bacterium]
MSPRAALNSEIYLAYVAVVAVILIAAGLAIVMLRWLAGRDVSHATRSYAAWLIMVPTVAAALFLGRIATIVFIFALALCGFWEFARATGLIRERIMSAVVFAGIGGLASILLAAGFQQPPADGAGMFMAFPVFVTTAILAVPIVRNRAVGELPQIALAVLGFVYIGWMFGHLALLANSKHAYGYLCFLFVAVELNDVAAYTCGRLLGRHPLRGNISPKKTWEGAIGALAVSLVVPWLLWFSFPHFGPAELIVTGLVVGIGGQLGDLSMSVIKRDVGVKDMGTAISGHGGILDRIDSLLYVAPLFVHMVRAFHKVY